MRREGEQWWTRLPKLPLPIFLPILYLPPTRKSIVDDVVGWAGRGRSWAEGAEQARGPSGRERRRADCENGSARSLQRAGSAQGGARTHTAARSNEREREASRGERYNGNSNSSRNSQPHAPSFSSVSLAMPSCTPLYCSCYRAVSRCCFSNRTLLRSPRRRARFFVSLRTTMQSDSQCVVNHTRRARFANSRRVPIVQVLRVGCRFECSLNSGSFLAI